MSEATDEQLVRSAKKGDGEAFAELVRRYREKVYCTIHRFTRNHSETDDLAQETFLRAFRALPKFRGKSSFYTWIFRIAVNLSLNYLDKMKKEQGKEEYTEELLDREQPVLSSPESSSAGRELRERLNAAVDALPVAYRASFVLVVFQGMTHSQAARVLRCSENTLSWRMHKARKMLRAKLTPFLDEVRS